ncbi:DUF6527 family protein [Pseudomonas sp. PI1]|uniref:DUF6527 family protein n=1 Tax=Pseudomonas sp. PI1 TaxID=1582493 RepID=UPI0009E2E5A2|nr:DUF6527 family protein [Pseudomonas sp. PI1]
MIRIRKLEHRFIRSIPREIEPGFLYVSMEYGTAVHSCCCGCGEQVVTPLTPTDWSLTFDGESVSLAPSIGNWYSACRSHYFIRRGRVIEAGDWNRARIEAEHGRDKAAKARFYDESVEKYNSPPSEETASDSVGSEPQSSSAWSTIKVWLLRWIKKD